MNVIHCEIQHLYCSVAKSTVNGPNVSNCESHHGPWRVRVATSPIEGDNFVICPRRGSMGLRAISQALLICDWTDSGKGDVRGRIEAKMRRL